MTARDFVYWLQGYFEIFSEGTRNGDGQALAPHLNGSQIQCIQRHLNMVFKHEIDPSFGDKKHQDLLSHLHGGGSVGAIPKC